MPVYPGASVQQQRDHHRRVIGRPRPAIPPIGRIKPVEVHLADGVDHEPREVILRQPIPNIRRHQEVLLAILR
jgi:hypothetical protein